MLIQKYKTKNSLSGFLALIMAMFLVAWPLGSSAVILADDFVFPMKNYSLSSEFGDDRGGIYHLGEDIPGSAGTPVYNIGSGYVKHIGEHTRFGTVILVEHTLENRSHDKVVSLYGHLRPNDIQVQENQFVNKGQLLGRLGNTGENGGWGEHLHFAIHKGAYVDVNDEWIYWGLSPDRAELNNWYIPSSFINSFTVTSTDPDDLGKIITGAGVGGRSHVRVFTKDGQAMEDTDFFAFSEQYQGGADVAIGDTDGDQQTEIVVGAGPGNKPYVKVFDKNTKEVEHTFLAYDQSFTGGIRIAVGDINGDGQDEIITGAGPGGGAHARAFKADGTVLISKLFPFGEGQKTGVDVATGDTNGDGTAEIIVSAGPGGEPKVKIYQGNGESTGAEILAYATGFRGGVRVTAGDIDRDGVDEIITGAGPGGGPHVRAFEANGTPRSIDIFPFHRDFRGGVDVASFDYDGDGKDEIVAAQAAQGQARVKVYRYNYARTILAESTTYHENFRGGANVAGAR